MTDLLETVHRYSEWISVFVAFFSGLGSASALLYRKVFLPLRGLLGRLETLEKTLQEKIARMQVLETSIEFIRTELRPNGGGSLRDAITRIEQRGVVVDAKAELALTGTDVAVFETDAEGACTYVSPRWRDLTGTQTEDALGNGWVNGIHPDDRDKVYAEWKESVEQQRAFVLSYRTAAGRRVVGRSRAVRIGVGAGQKIVGYVGTIVEEKD